MDNQAVHNIVDVDMELEETSDSFLCCICLDLLYKPIVLSCGHISCFWCVHKSMNNLCESHCPICRHTYNHFPSICLMLHLLLSKMYPIAYKRREEQILEEEKQMGFFSPQFDSHSFEALLGKEFGHLGDSAQTSTRVQESTIKRGIGENMEQLGSVSLILNNGTTIPVQTTGGTVSIMENNSPQNKLNGDRKQIAVTDVLCSACKQLLIHPVALNCGHVYCETCIIKPTDKQIRCQICRCLNPLGCPKVCLELDHFLEEQFSKEYASRKDAIQPKEVQLNRESATTCSIEAGKLGFIASLLRTGQRLPMWADPHSKVHIGVGCDYCGMCPIIGDRYKCKDCVEAIGFDLCGDCYNTRSKLPGRFNQQHTPEHRLELVKPKLVIRHVMSRLVTGQLENGSPAFILADDIFEDGSPVNLPGDVQENTSNDSPATVSNTENIIDQNDSEPTG
ncbi:hypothetical protein ACOSQ3_003421 [Xanthoceras sorbifolium]